MKSTYANRGMDFECLINLTNRQYETRRVAKVIKVPTSWKVIFKNSNGYRVPVKAFPEEKAFLDFVGVYKGSAITFDAKETQNETSFPLANIKQHQIKNMDQWENCGGISFLLVHFDKKGKTFLLENKQLLSFVIESENGGRKSIPYSFFEENCELVKSNNGIVLDYLSAIEKGVTK